LKLKDLAVLAFGSPEKKGHFWYSVAKRKARQYGFHLYTQHMIWKKQPFFREAFEKARTVIGIPDPRCFVLQSCLRSIARLEGDVAECGVRQGRSTIFMLTADLRDRQYHLFDSFEGLSEPSSEDRMHNGRTAGKRALWQLKNPSHAPIYKTSKTSTFTSGGSRRRWSK
jgi:hypothetical protein